jgi:hypothetical protein
MYRVLLERAAETPQKTRWRFQLALPHSKHFPSVFTKLFGNVQIALPVLAELLTPKANR